MFAEFLVSSAAFVLFAFWVFRVKFRKDYFRRGKLSFLTLMLGILVFAFHGNLLYLALPARWPWLPEMNGSTFLQIISLFFLGTGIIILLVAWSGIGTKISLGQDQGRLCTTGLYRYSRNPQLLGYGLVLSYFVIGYFSIPVFLWFLTYCIAGLFMVQTEEAFLAMKYGDEYQAYCRAVRRII
ncbi:MAG: methyltransferase [Bacteroides sp.]|nr:methyltransferase [Bacteroides sp.]